MSQTSQKSTPKKTTRKRILLPALLLITASFMLSLLSVSSNAASHEVTCFTNSLSATLWNVTQTGDYNRTFPLSEFSSATLASGVINVNQSDVFACRLSLNKEISNSLGYCSRLGVNLSVSMRRTTSSTTVDFQRFGGVGNISIYVVFKDSVSNYVPISSHTVLYCGDMIPSITIPSGASGASTDTVITYSFQDEVFTQSVLNTYLPLNGRYIDVLFVPQGNFMGQMQTTVTVGATIEVAAWDSRYEFSNSTGEQLNYRVGNVANDKYPTFLDNIKNVSFPLTYKEYMAEYQFPTTARTDFLDYTSQVRGNTFWTAFRSFSGYFREWGFVVFLVDIAAVVILIKGLKN